MIATTEATEMEQEFLLDVEPVDDGKRHRAWVFTCNNYTEACLARAAALESRSTGGSFGREVGDSGTPHLQGFVNFRALTSFKTLKDLLPRFWFEPKSEKSFFRNTWDYTQKGEQSKAEWLALRTKGPNYGLNADPTSWGVCPDDPKVKGGKGEDYYKQGLANCYKDPLSLPPSAQFEIKKFQGSRDTIDRTLMVNSIKDLGGCPSDYFEWHCGVPRAGKSNYTKLFPQAFKWTPDSGWNLYNFEETVIFMDMDHHNKPTMHQWKTWFDTEPFPARVLYGVFNIRPKRMIVNTNEKSFMDMFPGWSEDHVEAVSSRFQVFTWEHRFYLNERLRIRNPDWKPPDGLNYPAWRPAIDASDWGDRTDEVDWTMDEAI